MPVLCVHNGTQAATVDRLKAQFPQIQHLVIEQNRGYAGGANTGLNAATGLWEWTIFLTNDCELLSLPTLSRHPQITVPVIRRRSGAVDSAGGLWNRRTGRLAHCRSFAQWHNREAYIWPYVPGSAFLVHRDLWQSSGGFDESLFTYWEDVDWSIRLWQQGAPMSGDESFQIRHGVGKTCRKQSLYTIYYYNRNQRLVHKKHPVRRFWDLQAKFSLQLQGAKSILRLLRSGRFRDSQLLLRALRQKSLDNPSPL